MERERLYDIRRLEAQEQRCRVGVLRWYDVSLVRYGDGPFLPVD